MFINNKEESNVHLAQSANNYSSTCLVGVTKYMWPLYFVPQPTSAADMIPHTLQWHTKSLLKSNPFLHPVLYSQTVLPVPGVPLPTSKHWCHSGGNTLAGVALSGLLLKSINSLRPWQMDAISQTTFSNAFSWIKMFEFRLKFHWSLFPRVQLTIFQQWFR